jgi:hypothetical protein
MFLNRDKPALGVPVTRRGNDGCRTVTDEVGEGRKNFFFENKKEKTFVFKNGSANAGWVALRNPPT